MQHLDINSIARTSRMSVLVGEADTMCTMTGALLSSMKRLANVATTDVLPQPGGPRMTSGRESERCSSPVKRASSDRTLLRPIKPPERSCERYLPLRFAQTHLMSPHIGCTHLNKVHVKRPFVLQFRRRRWRLRKFGANRAPKVIENELQSHRGARHSEFCSWEHEN
jgi:hypothetical protein